MDKRGQGQREVEPMTDSIYKVVELVGTSSSSWEEAVQNVVTRAAKTLRDIRIVEVLKLDVKVENGTISAYRAKVSLSFKFEG